ncbi:unnamed protein product [Parajaminaea phylloscopi]
MRAFIAATALVALCTASNTEAAPTDPAQEIKLEMRKHHDKVLAQHALASDPAAFSRKSYDYVVVGAGTAGLAVAARLSESGKYSVGVLESGPSGFGDPINDIPGQFGANLGSKYDYNYTTQANSATGVTARPWPRGHIVGGSSALNFLVWDAAAKAEYNAWEELGATGWNWNSMNKYMKQAETFTTPDATQQQQLHISVNPSNYGHQGAVKASFPRYVSKQVQNWIPALQALGIPKNDQPLAGDNTGASVQPSNINPVNSTRSYSAPAYFWPNSARPNLSLLPNARVDRINFGNSYVRKAVGGKQKANSVCFTSGGKQYTVKVNKEVIVSGGTVNSPQILELSGIGSSSVLSKAGIRTIIDNANVGENLQDHTYSYAAYELAAGNPTLDSLRWNTTFATEQKQLYANNKVSILDETVPSIAYVSVERILGKSGASKLIGQANSYVKSVNAPYKATLQKQIEFLQKYPDQISQMELIGVDGFFASSGFAPENGKTYITFLSASQHLLARGYVHITSKNSADAPTIQPNYYNNQFDTGLAVAGLRYLRKIAGTSQYANYIAKEVVPGTGLTSDADLTAFLKNTGTMTEYHPIGSASMLPRDKGGVVDPNLVVYGTSNVRVIDGSVLPVHVSAHIQRTIYGVAERGAALILGTA